jgi:hypothetical protein
MGQVPANSGRTAPRIEIRRAAIPVVTVKLPAKAPNTYQVRKEIAKQAKRAVLMAQDLASDCASITQVHFPKNQLVLTGDPSDRERLTQFMERRYGQAHGHQAVAHATRAGRLILGKPCGHDRLFAIYCSAR